MKCNYHTHTSRCKHAVGKDEDYVKAALDAGFDELGFSDHMPWPYATPFISDCRMDAAQLPDYLASVRGLRDRYQDRLPIHIGLESEYYPRYRDHLERLLGEGDVEYLILGLHFLDSDEEMPYAGMQCRTDDGVKRYTEAAVRAMDTGLFKYLAHPDVFLIYRTPDQFNAVCEESSIQIAKAAAAHHLPMEYNLLGLLSQLDGPVPRGYPSEQFWQTVRPYAGDVIIGVDAHDPKHLTNPKTFSVATQRLHQMGYQPLDHLTFD